MGGRLANIRCITDVGLPRNAVQSQEFLYVPHVLAN